MHYHKGKFFQGNLSLILCTNNNLLRGNSVYITFSLIIDEITDSSNPEIVLDNFHTAKY
jgi:hypothetical protein